LRTMSFARVPGLWLISLAAFSSMASMRVCDPMLVVLAQEFQVSVGEASRVISAFAVAYGCLQLFYGPLGDRIGKLRVIHAAVLACAVFSAITAIASDFHLLVLARAAMGASAAGIIPLSMAWLGDQVSYEHRQETLARLMSATVTGMMAGQWFGGWAAESLGWRSAFIVLSCMFALACVLLFVRMGPQRRASPLQAQGSYWQQALSGLALLRVARVRWVLTVTALEGAMAFGTLAFVPSQLVQHFELSAALAGGLMALYGVGGLLYSQMARRWLGWFGERGLARLGSALVAVGLLLLAWLSSGACSGGLHGSRAGFLHAAQHLADTGHADGTACARQCGHSVRLPVVLRSVRWGVAGGANRGPWWARMGVHRLRARHAGAGHVDCPSGQGQDLISGPRTPPG